jgi:hypothetical protein
MESVLGQQGNKRQNSIIMWAQLTNILIGLWIMISPAIFYADRTAANNQHITGPLIITFAVIALWEINRNVRLVNILTGSWLIISPLFIHFNAAMIWSNIIAGVLIIVFSLIKRKRKTNYGGGWKSLFLKDSAHMRSKV